MLELNRRLLILIVCRLVLISLVLGGAIFALPQQISFFQFFQPFMLAVYGLSLVYILLWKYTERPQLLYYTQFSVDLVLISLLILVSGGINSLFTSFYVFIIVYASLLRQRQGGVEALTLSIISYSGIVHLSALGWVPGGADIGPYPLFVYRISLNTLGFMGVAMLGIYLSERLQSAHKELGTAKIVHQSIVDSIRDGLLTLDSGGHITAANRSAEAILGVSEEEMLSKPLSYLLPEAVQTRVLASDFETNPRALHIESWTRNGRGDRLFIVISCSPLFSEAEEQIGYILSLQDFTEMKKLEEEHQFREKMAAIGQMAAGLAHEIRNPLGSLSGSLQVLRSELNLPDEKARLADIILRECERLNKIVGDFLVYAGPCPRNPEPTDVLVLVRETIDLFKNSPEFQPTHRIELIASGESVKCMADSDQLRQVIWNILQNGVRAMPDGGLLSIHVTSEDSQVRLVFRDQGIGMSKEEKRKMFQPFHSGFKKGIGFGMAIVYQIVREHGGEVEVQSEPGRGTLVKISLPERRERERLVSEAFAKHS